MGAHLRGVSGDLVNDMTGILLPIVYPWSCVMAGAIVRALS